MFPVLHRRSYLLAVVSILLTIHIDLSFHFPPHCKLRRFNGIMSIESKYNTGLLELDLPDPHSESDLLKALTNDMLMASVVRDVADKLYVHISAPSGSTDGAVSTYISSVYSQLWDEMVSSQRLGLSCVVTSDRFSSDLISLERIWVDQNLQFMVTTNPESADEVKRLRDAAGLPEVDVALQSPISDSFDSTKRKDSDGKLYYLDDPKVSLPRFRLMALGGTFDRIHNGHKKLFTLAGCTADKIICGITSDSMLKGKAKASMIADCAKRMEGVRRFCSSIGMEEKFHIVEIDNPYGPTIDDPAIESIIVSSETISGAFKINVMRAEKGFAPLSILVSRRLNIATLSSSFVRKLEAEDGSSTSGSVSK